jgi:hypothetical protein
MGKKKQNGDVLAEQAAGRPVRYPEPGERPCRGDAALTVEQAKELLGWEEEPVDAEGKPSGAFQSNYLFKDRNGRRIRCKNNVNNRPFYSKNAEKLTQDHLMGRWRYNGEPVIIGKTELILNGQHSLASVVFAEQERTGKNREHWEARGLTKPITMEKLVVLGIEETDDVVNTMDTCLPRSLADVLYRSRYFAHMPAAERKTVSKITEGAIKLLRLRTGADTDPWAKHRTHAEDVDFLERHPSLLKAVAHIHTENPEGAISKKVPAGAASAMMYLMAASFSDPTDYYPPPRGRNDGDAHESKLKLEHPLETGMTNEDGQPMTVTAFEKAGEFWVLLGSRSPSFSAVEEKLSSLSDPDMVSSGSLAEKLGVISKAWIAFLTAPRGGIDPRDLKLDYKKDPDTGEFTRQLVEVPTVGGIDLGVPKKPEGEPSTTTAPTPEEIEALKEQARAERQKKADDRKAKATKLLEQRAAKKKEAESRQGAPNTRLHGPGQMETPVGVSVEEAVEEDEDEPTEVLEGAGDGEGEEIVGEGEEVPTTPRRVRRGSSRGAR